MNIDSRKCCRTLPFQMTYNESDVKTDKQGTDFNIKSSMINDKIGNFILRSGKLSLYSRPLR